MDVERPDFEDQASEQSQEPEGQQEAQDQGVASGNSSAGQALEQPEADLDHVRIEDLPAEAQAIVRSFQADYTRKTQTVAQQRRELEAVQSLQAELQEAGVDPGQVRQALDLMRRQGGGFGTPSPDTPGPGGVSQDPELDRLVQQDAVLERLRSAYQEAATTAEQAALEASYANRVEQIQDRLERQRGRSQTEVERLQADPSLGPFVKSAAELRRVQTFAKREGIAKLEHAARILFAEDLAEARAAQARNSVQVARKAALPAGQPAGASGPRPVPSEVAVRGSAAITAWLREHDPGRLPPNLR